MTVQIIASAWNYFHRINKQDFSGVIVQAIAMSKLINDFDKDDIKRLNWLMSNTNKKINRPIFELDRYVDETKGKVSNNRYTFKNGTFSQDEIQNFLCEAITEVYGIIYKNFKDFKIEEKMYIDNEFDENIIGGW